MIVFNFFKSDSLASFLTISAMVFETWSVLNIFRKVSMSILKSSIFEICSFLFRIAQIKVLRNHLICSSVSPAWARPREVRGCIMSSALMTPLPTSSQVTNRFFANSKCLRFDLAGFSYLFYLH